jgi:hypothetical protein
MESSSDSCSETLEQTRDPDWRFPRAFYHQKSSSSSSSSEEEEEKMEIEGSHRGEIVALLIMLEENEVLKKKLSLKEAEISARKLALQKRIDHWQQYNALAIPAIAWLKAEKKLPLGSPLARSLLARLPEGHGLSLEERFAMRKCLDHEKLWSLLPQGIKSKSGVVDGYKILYMLLPPDDVEFYIILKK